MSERPPQHDSLDPMVQAYKEAEAHVQTQRPMRPAHQREVLDQMLGKERQRTHAELLPRRQFAMAGGALALAIVLAVVGWSWLDKKGAGGGVPQEPELVGVTPNCQVVVDAPSDLLKLEHGCTWQWRNYFAQLDTLDDGVDVQVVEDGLRVDRGAVRFRVDSKRPRSTMVRVRVSGGIIDVVGTEFTVKEFKTHGQVALHEGSIRFTSDDGKTTMMSPGEMMSWGDARAEANGGLAAHQGREDEENIPRQDEPEEFDRKPKTSGSPPSQGGAGARDSKGVPQPAKVLTLQEEERLTARDMKRVRAHRRLGELSKAIRLLDSLEKQTSRSATREVISYEKGDILEQMEDVTRQCKHWKRHLKRFERGRYAAQVKSRYKKLSCSP